MVYLYLVVTLSWEDALLNDFAESGNKTMCIGYHYIFYSYAGYFVHSGCSVVHTDENVSEEYDLRADHSVQYGNKEMLGFSLAYRYIDSSSRSNIGHSHSYLNDLLLQITSHNFLC